MILAVDAGNTNITIGAFELGAEDEADRSIFCGRIATNRRLTRDELTISILQILRLYDIDPTTCEDAVIGSVVPELTEILAMSTAFICDKAVPLVVAPGVKTGLNIRIDNPAQLGADLIAGAVAAKSRYSLPCFVVDMGTATKISALNENGDFLGCSISAGVGVSLEALAGSASLLPSIGIMPPKSAIGTNSVDAMRSGVILGAACMIDGMIYRMEATLGQPAGSIVATGGYANEITSQCQRAILYREDLVLLGLKDIYLKNRPLSI
jgi:type III pantothenate kinase